jgi:5-oxoprolinase (ATP-hydrolysing)
VLCCFGGAGGQVACLIADTLGMKRIFLHPYAGVLSAYGMGLADVRTIREAGVEEVLNQGLMSRLDVLMQGLEREKEFETQSFAEGDAELRRVGEVVRKVSLKYAGTNSILSVDFDFNSQNMRDKFETEHELRYGFIQLEKAVIVESVSVEVIQKMDTPEEAFVYRSRSLLELPEPVEFVRMFTADKWHDTPVYRREDLQPGDRIFGAAIIVEKISTIVVEPSWEATVTKLNHLVLEKV